MNDVAILALLLIVFLCGLALCLFYYRAYSIVISQSKTIKSLIAANNWLMAHRSDDYDSIYYIDGKCPSLAKYKQKSRYLCFCSHLKKAREKYLKIYENAQLDQTRYSSYLNRYYNLEETLGKSWSREIPIRKKLFNGVVA